MANEIQLMIAGNPNTSKQALYELLGDSLNWVDTRDILEVCANSDVLDRYAKKFRWPHTIAQNPNTSGATLTYLLRCRGDSTLRKWISINPNTTKDALLILMEDADHEIRARARVRYNIIDDYSLRRYLFSVHPRRA